MDLSRREQEVLATAIQLVPATFLAALPRRPKRVIARAVFNGVLGAALLGYGVSAHEEGRARHGCPAGAAWEGMLNGLITGTIAGTSGSLLWDAVGAVRRRRRPPRRFLVLAR
jgi:hypothetical protein